MAGFIDRVKKAASNLWGWFKGLPIIKPLWALLYSRKMVITAALVAFALEGIPQLAPTKAELEVVIAQAVVILLAAVAQSLGIAAEDYASKVSGKG